MKQGKWLQILSLFSVLIARTVLAVEAVPQTIEQVTLQLKWRHQFQFAGYYAAKEKGFYKEAGLDVNIVEAAPGMDSAQEVITGRAQFGVVKVGWVSEA